MVSRACGLLLHITSLPGRLDGGDLGAEARRFVDDLAATGASWWQTLPVGPPGYGGSPYDSPSAFAGSTDLISLDDLAVDLSLGTRESKRESKRKHFLRQVWEQGHAVRTTEAKHSLDRFRERERSWLEDHATFHALSEHLAPLNRHDWPADLRTCKGASVAAARRELGSEIDFECWLQSLFAGQWSALKHYAHTHGVELIGDMPIFVASHSADVWSHPELFELDDQARPVEVAAVPPDAFSDTGQLWGNPVYRWARHRQDDFSWWRRRVASSLERFDLLRIDHFRGLVANWRVPADARTAVKGRWARGPGRELWRAFVNDAELPLEGAGGWPTLFAEDLGHITPAVRRSMRRCGLWGTRVLQFVDSRKSEHHPSNLSPETVYYTGTHDNDTTRGWLDSLNSKRKSELLPILDIDPEQPVEDQVRAIVRTALESPARLVILPLQDILGLGREARMNTPGTTEHNWCFRAPPDALSGPEATWLSEALAAAGRSAERPRGEP